MIDLSRAEKRKLKNQVKAKRLRRHLRTYAAIPSRHYRHSGNAYAVQMLVDDFEQINGEWTVRKCSFRHNGQTLFNVEATLLAKGSADDRIVVICAHLDCTAGGDPAYQPLIDPAPGADDDGSGIAAVLTAARAIIRLAKDAENHRQIRFVLFNAEEERQAGSVAYARSAEGKEDFLAVYDLDMIGYASSENIFEVHAGFEADSTTQDLSIELAELISRMCTEVSPGLQVQIYPGENDKRDIGEGFSDHTSFHRYAFPACLITENFFAGPGSIMLKEPNPAHHLPEDKLDKLDFEYAAGITRAVTAAAWHTATREWPRKRASENESERQKSQNEPHH